MSLVAGICPACSAEFGTVGVCAHQLCPTCVHREKVEGTVPNFGVGVPGLIAEECYALRDMLHEKQRSYGNSALDPVRIFSKADPEAGLRVRLDDKLSRLARGEAAGEDVIADLLGYLILLRIAMRLSKKEPT